MTEENAAEVVDENEETKYIEAANTGLGVAERLIVQSTENYEEGVALSKDGKELLKAVEAYWEPIKKGAKAVHQGICDREKANLAPIKKALDVIKDKLIQFDDEEEAKRRAELEALEKENAAAHQKRMTAAKKFVEKLKGATEDISAQIKSLQEELDKGIAAESLNEEDMQVLESEISVLEMSLKSKADAAVLRERQAKEAEERANATAAPVTAAPEKTAGVSRSVVYTVEVVDFMALIKAIAAGDVPFNPEKPLFTVSKSALKALATAGTLKAGTTHGCRVTKGSGLSIR
jgi:chromosome segregation ATPase